MTDASLAVFLSYASEDAAAAARIAGSLRAAGMEVWFDRSELRGGDAWDRTIREQIHRCRLFVPIISSHTEARTEGYFRREWRLAVERTHDLSERVAFLLPVAVDTTAEADADVPDAFRHVQWTRMPGGEPTTDFVARVAALLAGGSAGGGTAASRTTLSVTPAVSAPGRPRRWALPAFAVLVLVAAGGWFALGPRIPTAGTAHPAGTDKSLAVLPLTDASPKHDQANIAEGIADQVRDLLSRAPDLRVIARASSVHAAKAGQPLKEVAGLLGVRYILDGSVREFSDRLRIAMELDDAASGLRVWSKTFDRDARDVFAVEDEIAKEVGQLLQVVLGSAQPATASAARLDAYRSYIEGAALARTRDPSDVPRAVAALRTAVAVDPSYAAAWSELATALITQADAQGAGSMTNQTYEAARHAASQAIALAPDDPQGYVASAHVLHDHDWNWDGALALVQKAKSLDPRSVDVRNAEGAIAMTLGRYPQAIDAFREVIARDPLRRSAYTNLADALLCSGRPAEAEAEIRRSTEIIPSTPGETQYLLLSAWAQGRFAAAYDLAVRIADPQLKAWSLALVLQGQGRSADANQQLAEFIRLGVDGSEDSLATLYVYSDRPDEAFAALDTAYAKREYGVTQLKCRWQDRPFFHDPRYFALLARAHLPP